MATMSFNGEFIKHKRYTAYNEILKMNYTVDFDDALFRSVSAEIISTLGEKKKYSVQDATKYFQTKYAAFRVPWEYSLAYEDTTEDRYFSPDSHLDPDDTHPFDYSKMSGEKNVTLVVDTVFNTLLRGRYPDILVFENQQLENKKCASENLRVSLHCCPIIVIGYRKENIINSMFQICNSAIEIDVYNHRPFIPDIEYEFWFFRQHS